MGISAIERGDGKVVIRIATDLDSYSASIEFKEALEEIYRKGAKEVVLDLDAVEKINSFGTGKILMFYRRFKQSGGEMYFKAPLRGMVKEVFEELKFDKLLHEYTE